MENAGRELVKAIGRLVSETESAEDVVVALMFLRSAVVGGSPPEVSDAPHNIAKLADACRSSNVVSRADTFTAILELLLYEVAPGFLSGFTQEKRELLFDAFFLAAPSSECVLALVPALAGEFEPDEDGKPTVRLVQTERLLVKCLHENFGVQKLAEEFGQTADSQRYVSQVAQLVSSIPDRVRPDAPPSLTAPLFFSSVTSQLLAAARSRWKASTNVSKDGTFVFIGDMFSKLCKRGYADVIAREVASSLLESFTRRKSTAQNESTYWQVIVSSMRDLHALERFGEATLYELCQYSLSDEDAQYILCMLFGSPASQVPSVRKMIGDKFIFWKVFPFRVLKWILHFSVLDDAGKVIQKDTVNSLAETWSDRNFIQSASPEQQTYVTAALGICLKAMTKQELSEAESFFKFLLEGVDKRLESPLEHVRRMAKQIALAFSFVFNPERPLLLDANDSVQDLSDWDALGLLKGPSPQADLQVKNAAANLAKSILLPEDPDAVVDLSKPVSMSWMKEAGEGDSDSESEGSLKPYDMSDDETDLEKGKYPSQLSACASFLRKGDDSDAVLRALKVCEKYIRLRPDELESSAADLAQALVHVRCSTVAVEGEEDAAESRRQRSLAALLVFAPLTTAGVLTRELYSVHVDISQRLMILDVLSAAAQELATGANSETPDDGVRKNAGPWKEVSLPYPGNSMLTLGQTYERELPPKAGQREVGKSRRWGNRALQLRQERWKGDDTTTTNKFAPVAAAFMLPVMRDHDKPMQGLNLLAADYLVLARMIQMLGFCMESLVNQVNAASLGTTLLEMLRSRQISGHSEPYVRRSVLFAMANVLVALQSSHLVKMDALLADGLEWTKEWLLSVANNDSDDECVKMAVACFRLHSELVFQASRTLEHTEVESSLLPVSTSSRRSLIVPL